METSLGSDRIPIPLRAALERMNLGRDAPGAREVLGQVSVEPLALQEFRPLTQSLEWELSELHWSLAGLLPFVENDVPFLINNSGRLSEDVAVTLFANCLESDPGERLVIAEFGAGTGLFARYLLDAFRGLCEQEGRDYYGRLTYLVSDRSRRAVEQWEERGLFEGHAGHVIPLVGDARRPQALLDGLGEALPPRGLRAAFYNYVLDVLPATVIRRGPDGVEELRVRTHLTDDRSLLAQYTRLGPEEIRQRAASDEPERRAELIPLLSLFELEAAFLPWDEPNPLADEALRAAEGRDPVVLNHAALEALGAVLDRLDPSGFVLVNDYGATRPDRVADQAATQRFGPTSALGLNYPHLERHFAARSATVRSPEGDDEKSIHARLLARSDLLRTSEAFRQRFGADAARYLSGPQEEARRQLAAGRRSEALESYRIALERSPRDWSIIGEAAEFVGLQLRDYASGLELARAAVALNPWYSTWLWNVLGDCLYLLDRFEDAHEAYLQARRIDPNDPRTNLNLAFTLGQSGRFREALEAIAAGLARDARGFYRDRLAEKQQQILAALASRSLGEQERLARRAARLRAANDAARAPAST